ncbi:MAG: hypothetical protein C4294_20305, partial [Nitrospiraceae bacterium]
MTAHPDTLQLALLTGALFMTVALAERYTPSRLLLGATLAGLAFGTKFLGVALVPFLLAAAALVGFDDESEGPQLVDALTHCDYTTFEHMAFHMTDYGFKMELSSYVPALLGVAIEDFVDRLLDRNHLQRRDIRFWGVHPGGLKILEYIERRLELERDDL